jgi:hypothetical protein
MAKTDGHREAYTGFEEKQDIHFVCYTKRYRARARAILDTRNHGQDLYRGVQLVLR